MSKTTVTSSGRVVFFEGGLDVSRKRAGAGGAEHELEAKLAVASHQGAGEGVA